MSFESTKFRFSDVERLYHQSRDISPIPKTPTRGGVKAATVTCKACGHTWRARQYGDGQLHGTLGGVIVMCPACEEDEHVEGSIFDHKT